VKWYDGCGSTMFDYFTSGRQAVFECYGVDSEV